jgi:hypothetical protein
LELAKADELGFNALIKPILNENQVNNENNNIDKNKDNQSDIKKDNQSDIPKDNKRDIQKDNKKNEKKANNKTKNATIQKNNQQDIKRDIPKDISKSPMDILLASKKKKIVKKFVGLHLPSDVDDALTQFKKDNDIDKSEVVAIAVKLLLKDYFNDSEEGAM